jgi:hypothetical protein
LVIAKGIFFLNPEYQTRSKSAIMFLNEILSVLGERVDRYSV